MKQLRVPIYAYIFIRPRKNAVLCERNCNNASRNIRGSIDKYLARRAKRQNISKQNLICLT